MQVEHTMVEGLIDLSDPVVHAFSARSMEVRKLRGSSYMSGRHSITITDAGIEVFPRMEQAFSQPLYRIDTRKPLATGLAGLDRLSGAAGLLSSSSTLLVGPVGSGKTTFGMQFLANSSADERGLFFGFHESPAEVLAAGDANGLGLSMLVSKNVLILRWQPQAENILDELGHRLVRSVAESGVRRVFVDGLCGFTSSAVYRSGSIASSRR